MANMTDVCEEVVKSAPGALSFAVIDLQSGQLLACVHTVPYYTQRYLEAMANSAVDMFRGSGVTSVESLAAEIRGIEPERMVREVQMATTDSYQFMMLSPQFPDILLMLTTDRETSLGSGWIVIRAAIPKLEAVLA